MKPSKPGVLLGSMDGKAFFISLLEMGDVSFHFWIDGSEREHNLEWEDP